MLSLKGTGVHKGIAVGKLVFYERQLFHVEKQTQEDTQTQVQRYRQAKEQAVMQVQTLHKLALREISSENAAIFQAHHLLLEDQDFNGYVLELIKNQHTGAEYAVQQAAETFYRMFSSIPDPYLQQRAIDVQDVAHRLISNLTYGKVELFVPEYPSILASDELVPSEVIQLPCDKVLAFVTKSGSENSHAAIITRDRNIPYLLGVGEGLDRSCQGLNHLIGKPNRTIDGREVKIFASITEPLDIEQVIRSDADGLGLMRSEFLYLKRDGLPGEEEQVSAYREVIRQMKGKRTVIRTLDFGARKLTELPKNKPEMNPSLGFRSIRICLAMPQMFQTQLRAIYRAACYGPVSILFPMVDSVEQLEEILRHLQAARESLKRDKMEFDPQVRVGLVIETPASVILSRELAEKVDFFHIDTNDLVQYALAVDRQNPRVNSYYNTRHPAVMRMIEMVIDAAHTAGIKVTVSGDMADDERMLGWFIRTGVDGFNVSAASVLPLRRRIRSLDLGEPLC